MHTVKNNDFDRDVFRRSYGAAHRPDRVKNGKSARTRTDRYERTSFRSMIYSDAFPREESTLVTMAYFKKETDLFF